MLRPELTDLPERIRRLPIDKRGYPVPAFVDWINGEPEFRAFNPTHWKSCVKERLCWVCGERLGRHLAFLIGPMCAVNRNTSEPPSHYECAAWSARFCPFLSRPHMVRREDELINEEKSKEQLAGFPILRNPGVACVWITDSYKVWRDDNGKPLIRIGDARRVEWYAEGRSATRAEVEESIRTGMPLLEGLAQQQDGAIVTLRQARDSVTALMPAITQSGGKSMADNEIRVKAGEPPPEIITHTDGRRYRPVYVEGTMEADRRRGEQVFLISTLGEPLPDEGEDE